MELVCLILLTYYPHDLVHKHFLHYIHVHVFSCFCSNCFLFFLITDTLKSVLYTCCRDGFKRTHTTPNKTPHLKQPAQKLDRSCIARMTAIEELATGKVKVLYVSTHTSHEPCTQEVESLNSASQIESSITVGRYI